ncbi:four-carbon acid sugar kinase family protein [Allorhizobium sp. BGMRC 0089]|uniref:four-carbon acid sugar kinase family protein n=1 Tax=Allorhizobium sonneratiae TaxID=2934936 RepID=UPI0020333CFE|nr:four-carbon acid sugar kinase family protein [Allorhizobium sonneratiae]MCM2294079.1 four-carbon acid sugar kinase family protein [Allorhizobium sonneratiae]
MCFERETSVTKPMNAPQPGRHRLFLIADDLTGALDTAAQFASADRPIDVRWDRPSAPVSSDIALTTGTREVDARTASTTVTAMLQAAGNILPDQAFIKIDSLLRGNPAVEILAAIDHFRPDATVIAPAFPAQGRVTRSGRQYVLGADGATACATSLAKDFAGRDRTFNHCQPGGPIPSGLSIVDAESDEDLAKIVAAGNRFTGRVLWVGSAGLAKALSPSRPSAAPLAALSRPVLGLFGTGHPVTQAQLQSCPEHVLAAMPGDPDLAERIGDRLASRGVALVWPTLPEGLPRDVAAAKIASLLDALTRQLDPPGTLIVSGGETLMALCRSLQADKLVVKGEIMPGIPVSRISAGRFDGVTVISKSGAFGAPDLFQRLLKPEFQTQKVENDT